MLEDKSFYHYPPSGALVTALQPVLVAAGGPETTTQVDVSIMLETYGAPLPVAFRDLGGGTWEDTSVGVNANPNG